VPEALEPAQGGVEDGPAGAAVHVGHEADAAGVALVASPVVQGPAAAAGAWQEVVRHLASESTAWDRRQDASLDNGVQGHENGAAWGERRCSSNTERTEVGPARQQRV
jgi:exonuclease VII large subunit